MIEPRSALVTFVVGLALLVGSFGYIVGRGTARSPRPSPEASPVASPTPIPTVTPSETSASPPFTALATALPRVLRESTARVYAAFRSTPSTPGPTPTKRPTPTSTAVTSQSIRFVNLPSEARSGQSFTVEWRVDGPAGMSGESTTLTTSYQISSSGGGSQSSASSKGQQSFGAFTIPKTFSTHLTYGGQSGTIQLRASARVGGQEISTESSIRLTN